VLSPADVVQGESVRIMYVHVPSAWLAYLAFIVTAVCSAGYLWPRSRSLTWDRIAGASAEIGVLFMGITLVTGMLWGRITWGVFWQWDPGSPPRRSCSSRSWATWPCATWAAPMSSGPSGRPSWVCSPSSRSPWCTSVWCCGGPAPGGHRAQPQRRGEARRLDAVHALLRGGGVHPRLRVAGAAPQRVITMEDMFDEQGSIWPSPNDIEKDGLAMEGGAG
jgi:hypothetical protein